jgi:aspartoacylase
MGLSLVVSNTSQLTWLAASYLHEKFPDLKVYRWQGDEEGAFVDSLGLNGFAIEVGAVPQGVLRADLFEKTKELVYALLDFLNGDLIAKREIDIYDHVSLVDYPRDSNGEITAMVHYKRQDRDFELIQTDDPMFLTFDGQMIAYEGSESLYGVFINEAAYYEKGFAMCLARKIEHTF